MALKLLKEQISEEDILGELLPTLPSYRSKEAPVFCGQQTIIRKAATLRHPYGYYYLIPILTKRFVGERRQTARAISGQNKVKCILSLYQKAVLILKNCSYYQQMLQPTVNLLSP